MVKRRKSMRVSPPLYLELLFDIRVPARGPCGDQRRFIADFLSRQLVVRRFLQEKLAHFVVGRPLNVQKQGNFYKKMSVYRTVVMPVNAPIDLRCHYTRNLEKGGRGVGKLRAVERRSRSGAEVSARECAAARCMTSN